METPEDEGDCARTPEDTAWAVDSAKKKNKKKTKAKEYINLIEIIKKKRKPKACNLF